MTDEFLPKPAPKNQPKPQPKPRKKRTASKFVALRDMAGTVMQAPNEIPIGTHDLMVEGGKSAKECKSKITAPGRYLIVCIHEICDVAEQKQIVFKAVK